MTSLYIIGIGPGDGQVLTQQARDALRKVTSLYGYGPYLERVGTLSPARRHPSDNGDELARARQALGAAAAGEVVGVVSGGDAGVFGMASAVFEAMETGPEQWRHIDVTVVPGVTAVLAAAARLGAPLGGDFVVMSLSDNLKPWSVIEARLRAAARADFVIALYNVRSRARPAQLECALDILRQDLPAQTCVAFVQAVTRPDERMILSDLGACDAACADMRTLVLIGASTTRRIAIPDGDDFLYTPRSIVSGQKA